MTGIFVRGAVWLRTQARTERDRWPLWLPAAMGLGIGLYFALPVEPSIAAGGAAALAGAGLILAFRQAAPGSLLRILVAALIALCAGFALAKLRTETLRAPAIARETGPVKMIARVVATEARPKGFRLILAPEPSPALARRLRGGIPARIRVSARYAKTAPAPGSFVRVTAVLEPPPEPAVPGGYDFARWAYFRQIGAVGYLYGRPHPVAAPRALSAGEALQSRIETVRNTLTAHIRDVLPGPDGAIAAALITGKRAAVSEEDETAFRESGLTHVLSISGLHLALAGGIFFWSLRALLALFPLLAQRHPIKKWAAVGALAGSFAYLVLSGCDVPAVRSELMLATMFAAILLDRPALTMRSVALAAALVMALEPESLTEPGCQMSFACVIGLIALAESLARRRRKRPDGTPRRSIFARIGRYGLGILAASLIATLASAPIAIFHFDRAAQYGLVSNLLAEPVVGVIIMPAATAAMVLMPFGLDRLPLVVMGQGVAAMRAIAYGVADLPGASNLVPAWPLAALLFVMGGLLWIALWRRSWRWLGLCPAALGLALALLARPPDLLIARDMGAAGVRGADGRLSFFEPPTDDYAAELWLRRAGDARTVAAAARPGDGIVCDGDGCIARLGGKLLAYDKRIGALEEDCRRADILISRVPVKIPCAAPVRIDRFDVLDRGGHAVWLNADGSVRIRTVSETRGKRPWVL